MKAASDLLPRNPAARADAPAAEAALMRERREMTVMEVNLSVKWTSRLCRRAGYAVSQSSQWTSSSGSPASSASIQSTNRTPFTSISYNLSNSKIPCSFPVAV